MQYPILLLLIYGSVTNKVFGHMRFNVAMKKQNPFQCNKTTLAWRENLFNSMSQVSSLKHVKPLKDIMYVTFTLCDRSLKVYTHLRPSAQCYINLITSL